MKTFSQTVLRTLFLGFIFCCCRNASAAPQTVWRIGTFNESPSEFNTGKQGPPLFGSRYPKGELVYIVGKSQPATDWPGYQEGATIGKPGSRPHPYTIQFELEEVPQGLYTFKAGLLSETARVAELRVEINGHAALFYQHPKLNYGGGDRDMVTLPIAAADAVAFDLPTPSCRKEPIDWS